MRVRVSYLLFCGVLFLFMFLFQLGPDVPQDPSAEGLDASNERAAAFSKIRFTLPDGVTAGPYCADAGLGGGCLLLPYLNADAGSAPDMWEASGMISFYDTDGAITWNGDAISSVSTFMNHSSFEDVGTIDHLAAPAFLMKGDHDLYTLPELYELEQAGIDLSTVKATASYWYVFFARPEDEVGVAISLNADEYSRDEMLRFAQSVRYEGI